MAETNPADEGGPGMFLCGQSGRFVPKRCDECAQCIIDNQGCADCEAECPPWEPDAEPVSVPRRAPHMECYTGIRRYSTEEHRDGHRVTLTIGVQSFILSDGVGNHHESRAAAEWSRRQLCLALDTLRSEVIEECAKVADRLSDSASDHESGAALSIAEDIRALKGGVK